MGKTYTVLSGVKPGETVVTEGSFFLRAESASRSTAPSGWWIADVAGHAQHARASAIPLPDTCRDNR